MSIFSFVIQVRVALAIAVLVAAPMDFAAAQSARSDPYPNKSAAELFQSYNSGASGTLKGQDLLIGVLNKVLPSTDANIQAARRSLARASATDDKILLVKVLASMYTPRVRSQQNLLIESDIRKLIDSPAPRLAAEAVLEYSRLSYPADRYQVLQRARGAKIIDDDAYYGELAHGLRFSSPEQQLQMLSELEAARNLYGNEVLASTFGAPDTFDQLDAPARPKLLKILSSHEPNFPMALNSFGVVDMARYVTWIDAVATIESKLTSKPYADLVVGRLSGPEVDPRKILAVFANPEGQRVMRESRDASQLRKLFTRAQVYSYSLPENAMLNGAVASFSKQMAAMPPAAK
jgi:hypothetical protein